MGEGQEKPGERHPVKTGLRDRSREARREKACRSCPLCKPTGENGVWTRGREEEEGLCLSPLRDEGGGREKGCLR